MAIQDLKKEAIHPLFRKAAQLPAGDYEGLLKLFEEIKEKRLAHHITFSLETTSSPIWHHVTDQYQSLCHLMGFTRTDVVYPPAGGGMKIIYKFNRASIEDVISTLQRQIEIEKSPTKRYQQTCYQIGDKVAAYATTITFYAANIISAYAAGAFCYGGARYLAQEAFRVW